MRYFLENDIANAHSESIDSLDAQLRMVPVEPGSLLVAYRGYLAGSIRIAEMVRAEAVDAVSIFRSMGLGVHLLSGDSRAVVVSVARQLTIEDFDADMAPSEKLAKVQDLVREGKRIVMVGDGINDAPALAEATVGIAVGSATDLGGQNASIRVRENGLLVCADLLQVAPTLPQCHPLQPYRHPRCRRDERRPRWRRCLESIARGCLAGNPRGSLHSKLSAIATANVAACSMRSPKPAGSGVSSHHEPS